MNVALESPGFNLHKATSPCYKSWKETDKKKTVPSFSAFFSQQKENQTATVISKSSSSIFQQETSGTTTIPHFHVPVTKLITAYMLPRPMTGCLLFFSG